MDKIFQDAKDKNVKSFVVYGKTADHKLYLDAAYTKQATKTEVTEAFKKGMLIVMDGDDVLAPVAVSGAKVVTAAISSSAIAGTEWTAKNE